METKNVYLKIPYWIEVAWNISLWSLWNGMVSLWKRRTGSFKNTSGCWCDLLGVWTHHLLSFEAVVLQKKSGPQTWSCPLCTRARLRKERVLSVSTTWPGHSRVFKDITRHSFQRWLAPCVCPQSRVLGRPGVNCHCLALFRSCVIPLCYHEATWPLAFQDGTSSFHKL